jgi:hypothetical protein
MRRTSFLSINIRYLSTAQPLTVNANLVVQENTLSYLAVMSCLRMRSPAAGKRSSDELGSPAGRTGRRCCIRSSPRDREEQNMR